MLSWVLIGLGLAALLAVLRLESGPIELGWLQPRIERALAPESGAVTVTAGRIELRLDKHQRTLDLVGIDVRYRMNSSEGAPVAPFLTFPEVELTLSIEALLKRGMIAASALHAEAPSLTVTRNEDGVIALSSQTGDQGSPEAGDFGAFLRLFAMDPQAGGRLSFLKRLEIEGGRVTFHDRRTASATTARRTDLTLIRSEGGVDAWLRADFPQANARPATLQLSARLQPEAEDVPFDLDVTDLLLAELPALWPLEPPSILAELDGVDLPMRLSVGGRIGLDGALAPLEVDLEAGPGLVDLPTHLAEPLDIDALTLKGTLDGDLGAADIEALSLACRGARLSGSGRAVWREEETALSLDLEASDVLVEDLPAFWPAGLGRDARDWVVENIEAGKVSEAEARFDLRPGDWTATPLREDAIQGRFAFEGLSVRYIDEMPPVVDASGTAEFDADRLAFDVEAGANGGVALTGGSVTITGMGRPGKLATKLRVLAQAESSIEAMLALLDHPPLEIPKELSIAPSDTAGSVVADLEVRLPLHNDVVEEDAVILADATLSGLSIARLPRLGSDVGLDQGAFALTVDEEAVRLEGKAAVSGIPLDISVMEPLEEGTATRRIVLAGALSRDQLAAQGFPVAGLSGKVGFEATVTETDTHFWIDLEADLARLAIAPSGIAWQKPAGQDGVLRASIAMPLDGPLEVKQFDVETGDLQASGSFLLAEDHLRSLVVDRLRLADTDAMVRYARNGKEPAEIVVEAASLDLDALFGTGEGDEGDSLEPFHAILRADRLRARGIDMENVEADAVHAADGWRSASVLATLPRGGKVALELAPDGDSRTLEIRSDDAGALIEALDLGQRIEGGTLFLTAALGSQDPLQADGRFEVTDFTLQDAPLLARMLTLASLTGIGNLLGGQGIKVDQLLLPFALDDQTLTLTDGLMRGSELGLTVAGDVALDSGTLNLEGTVIPVYTLNRLLGKVPVIGRILTGEDGRGAFAATYGIDGPKDNPTVYVNPLSLLTPGLIRDFVGGLINGTGEPPDLRETDD